MKLGEKVLICILIIFIGCSRTPAKVENILLPKDSISAVLSRSNNILFTFSERSHFAQVAKELIKDVSIDTLKTKYLNQLSETYNILNELDNYMKANKDLLKLYKKNNDSINTAKVYWRLGYSYQNLFKQDSAYYNYYLAHKYYLGLNNDLNAGNMLLNMAIIQESVKDYTGSEINTVKAISKLKPYNEYNNLYLAYNNLGVVYNNLNKFDLAIESHKTAIKYLKKSSENNNFFEAMSLNNIGSVYSENRDYKKSIIFFSKALATKELFKNRPQTYAMILDNLAYSNFHLGKTKDLPELFYKALRVRDSLNIIDGIVESNLHLSEYFLTKSDSLKALKYALKAKIKAQEANYNEGKLNSYLLLSKAQTSTRSIESLQNYIQLSDSLLRNERLVRDKFTRIAYETDEIKKQKEEVSKINTLLIVTLVISLVLFTIIYFLIKQRLKNKELLFDKKQEEANIEIYNLMLSQQAMFKEGSDNEKNRISEELHDGILGRLFGARLSLDSLNEGISEEEIKEREDYIEDLQAIEEDIRKISHNLKESIFNSNASFTKLIEQLVIKQSKITNFECKLSIDNLINWESISNDIKINCYRILQESIQNINKYAEASIVEINFNEESGILFLDIIDNGIGFIVKNIHKGIGLKNIKKRVKALKGKVEFISRPSEGTHIKVRIPL